MNGFNMQEQFKTISQRVALFQSFYKRENTRPLLGFFKGSEYPVHRYPSMKDLPEGRPLCPEDFPIDSFIEDSEMLFLEHEACGGDFIWSASAFWGIPWLEAMLGCPIYANTKTGSLYSEPPENFRGIQSLKSFDKEDPWLRLLKTYILLLKQKSSGRWPIGTTRMRGISDLLSAIYGGTSWILKMIDDPDEIHKSCRFLTDFWLEFARFQIELIPEFHGGIGSFYYYTWAPGRTVWCQEDATALLSPHLYNQFIKPYLEEISEELNGAIMHQHSTGYIPYHSHSAMKFHALEMHIDEGGPGAEELYPVHIELLKKKPLIIWGHIPEKDLDWIFSKLPYQGLSLITVVDSKEEARQLWRRYIN